MILFSVMYSINFSLNKISIFLKSFFDFLLKNNITFILRFVSSTEGLELNIETRNYVDSYILTIVIFFYVRSWTKQNV